MSITIEPITGVLGARLTGLNLAAINYDEFATLKAALDEHLVLYVSYPMRIQVTRSFGLRDKLLNFRLMA